MTRSDSDKSYYQNNKEKISIQKKEYYKPRRLKIIKRILEKKYNSWGTSLEDKKRIWKIQNKRCAVCGKRIPLMASHFDHCHKTNKVRGLLCSNCNLGIGMFKDDTNKLILAVLYLKENINGSQ